MQQNLKTRGQDDIQAHNRYCRDDTHIHKYENSGERYNQGAI
jgi:hypothetical protein